MEESAGRRAAAEFVGAFALVFAGIGSIAVGADLVGVALAHGLAIGVMASAVGHISGGQFNPAVTFGFLVTGRITPRLARHTGRRSSREPRRRRSCSAVSSLPTRGSTRACPC